MVITRKEKKNESKDGSAMQEWIRKESTRDEDVRKFKKEGPRRDDFFLLCPLASW
jgi:hypothetical protein